MSRAVREVVVAVGVAFVGWTACAAILSLTAQVSSLATAFAVNAVVAPVLFVLGSIALFRRGSALPPGLAAALFVAVGIGFAFVTALVLPDRGRAALSSLVGTWLPFALVFVVTWGVGLAVRDPSERAAPHSEHVEDSG